MTHRIITYTALLLGLSQLSCSDNPANVPAEPDGTCPGGPFSLSKPKADWTWQKNDTTEAFTAAAGNGTVYIVVGRKMALWQSADAVNWDRYGYSGGPENYYAALALRDEIIAVGSKGWATRAAYGQYGVYTKVFTLGHQNDLYALNKSSGMILGVGANGEMVKSFDGVVW